MDVDKDNELLIPNAFSPNGDGINDEFIISGSIDNEPSESYLEVYNRYGTVVYRSEGSKYGKDGKFWDGKGNKGNMVSLGQNLPNGTYFYIFNYKVNKDDGKKVTEES